MPKVHGVNLSPFVRKLRAALAEKGIAAESVPVFPGGGGDATWLEKSPLGKIPVLETDDGTFIPDSSVAIAYLERTHPESPLYPADANQYAAALFLEEYADTRLAEVCTAPFVERVVQAKIFGKEGDEARVQRVLAEVMPPTFDYLEGRIDDPSLGIVGGRFGVADIALGSMFVNFHHGGEKVDAGRWPKLAAYVDSIHARPSFKGLIAEEEIPS